MNYYDEIKIKLLKSEVYDRVKDYSKERYRVITYFEIGKLLSEAGNAYGEGIIQKYADKLVTEVGKKYNYRTLYRMRKFYQVFSNEKLTTLLSKLTWSHYLLVLSLKNINEIEYYINICIKQNLSVRDLEKKTGIVLSNSPTQTVGYEVKSELQKVRHSHPMLSLDKTKSTADLIKFAGIQDCILSCKLDGLTILLTYENGELTQAETRGNGEEGEIVTHNAKVFENIPLRINYTGHLEVEGEAIITYSDFEEINKTISDPSKKYKNPRNLVSGSVRQLDSSIAAKRHIKFIAWKVPTDIDSEILNNSVFLKLRYIRTLGFDIVPFYTYTNNSEDKENIGKMIEYLKLTANNVGYPIDGMVMTYDNIEYGNSLGQTGHHPKHSIAFKFYDEVSETVLKGVEWTIGKSGVLTPTAVFEPVEIDGTTVERASIHNVSILSQLELLPGDTVTVYKANQIIPQVSENLSAIERHSKGIHDYIGLPAYCPVCGGLTDIIQDNNSKILVCTNPNCKGKLLGKLTHFVSKNAMNIDGLSEATLEKFIDLEWLTCFADIYYLDVYMEDMEKLDGFGKRSTKKLLDSIEKSAYTTLDRFIYALCIPLIGRSASKTISNYFGGDFERFYKEGCLQSFDWTQLEDFGEAMSDSMDNYITNNFHEMRNLADNLDFMIPEITSTNNLSGMTFVITGSLNHFKNREEAKTAIESNGGKVSGSVSAKTSYLVNNDINSNSGKNKKAKELGVKIITEEELVKMLK